MSDEMNPERDTTGEQSEWPADTRRELKANATELAESAEEMARRARALRDELTDHLPPVIIKSGSLEVETRTPLPLIPENTTMRPRLRRYPHTGFAIRRVAALNGDGNTLWAGNTRSGCKVDLWLKTPIDAAEPQLSLDGNPLNIEVDDYLVPGGVTLPGFRPYLYRHLGTEYRPDDFLIQRIRLTEGTTVRLDTLTQGIVVLEGAQIWLWRRALP